MGKVEEALLSSIREKRKKLEPLPETISQWQRYVVDLPPAQMMESLGMIEQEVRTQEQTVVKIIFAVNELGSKIEQLCSTHPLSETQQEVRDRGGVADFKKGKGQGKSMSERNGKKKSSKNRKPK